MVTLCVTVHRDMKEKTVEIVGGRGFVILLLSIENYFFFKKVRVNL